MPDKNNLPPTFNMDNYAGTAKLDVKDWYTCLSVRVLIDTLLDDILNSSSSESEHKRVIKIFTKLIENMISFGSDTAIQDRPFTIFLMSCIQSLNIDMTADDLLFLDINYFSEDISSEKTSTFRKLSNNLFAEQENGFKTNIDLSSIKNIAVIDYSMPDDVLISDFKRWLAYVRKAPDLIGGKAIEYKDFRAGKLQYWHTYNLLPYMDILIWEKICNIQITDTEISEILFPDNDNGIDALKKTTKKHLRNLLTKDYKILEALVRP